MATWKPLKLNEVLEQISREEIVLPVIQRNLVWKPDEMALLFDTLFKGDSFGGIMTIKDIKGRTPIFEFHSFIKHYSGNVIFSKAIDKLDKNISYVVDGQQRLSSFYIGILGEFNSKKLYFDLLGEASKRNFNFKFAQNETELKSEIDNFDGTSKIPTYWYSVTSLFNIFVEVGQQWRDALNQIEDNLPKSLTNEQQTNLERNLECFQNSIFGTPNIGICEVQINSKVDNIENRLNVVELFRRLNQGGTKLDAMELMRSKLKAFSADNEQFLHNSKTEFSDICFNQDSIIKLLFLLQDDHNKDLANIDNKDSDFIQTNKERINFALKGTREFLKTSGLYEYFTATKPIVTPLYFIAYHLFHLDRKNEELETYFKNAEINNPDFLPIKRWLILSILNNVYRRGTGWDPNKTGIRKILGVMKENRNSVFPIEKIFSVYEKHPLEFKPEIQNNYEWLNWYDRDLLVFLMYDRPSNFRVNDIDHIHPKSILAKKENPNWSNINSIGNYQYLDFSTNRSKQDKELAY
jgi:uncharacterized protein with ParB-like and HNH nuclease domain